MDLETAKKLARDAGWARSPDGSWIGNDLSGRVFDGDVCNLAERAAETKARETAFPSGVRVERQGRNTLTISRDGIAYSVQSETALQLIRAHVCPRLAGTGDRKHGDAVDLLRQWVAVVDLSGVSAEDGALPDNPSMNPVTELLRKTRELIA